MPEPRRRPFTVADAMILVAAMTPGLILLRMATSLGLFETITSPFGHGVGAFLWLVTSVGVCILVGPSLAVAILTVRQPSRDRKHAIRGPGFVACLAVMTASVFPIAYFAKSMLKSHRPEDNLEWFFFRLIQELASGAGMMSIGAWLALVVVGRWRPRPTWTDRLGRVVGACWVILYACDQLYENVVQPWLEWWGG